MNVSQGRSLLSSRAGPAWRLSRRGAVRVAASWGAPIDYKPAKVASSSEVAKGQVKLSIAVDSTVAAGYTKPGQYVMLRKGDTKPGFFAIASTPAQTAESGSLELLIKAPAPGSNNVAELLTALKAGDEVDLSPVQGKGFPVERIPPQDCPHVVMFATGTGISPIKAAIESGFLAQRKSISLFYGTRNAPSTAYADLVDSWQELGVKVTHVYSDDKKGYVQDAFSSHPVLVDAASTGVLLCGHGDMCKAVTALLVSKGVAADRILMNY